jgi:hypothetical protein
MPNTVAVAKPVAEKRRHPRSSTGLTLDIHAKGQPVGRCRGSIADLSMGGISLKTDAELEEGMCLYLKLDGPLNVSLRGEIRHIGGETGGQRRYGVRLHQIIFGDQKKPEAFISARVDKKRLNQEN